MQYPTAQLAIANLNGATFIGIDTLTSVKLKGGKKNPMQGRVTKVMRNASTMCFSNSKTNGYENMVKRRLEQEGKDASSFVVGPRVWGSRIEGTPFVEHNGSMYLEVIFMKAGEVEYFLDGAVINKSDIEGLDDPIVNDEGQGGVNNKVVIRTYSLDSITAMRSNGAEWV